ncbi:hypothetical protein GCM10018953_48470 [Streptosporangium nondiastaticum]
MGADLDGRVGQAGEKRIPRSVGPHVTGSPYLGLRHYLNSADPEEEAVVCGELGLRLTYESGSEIGKRR